MDDSIRRLQYDNRLIPLPVSTNEVVVLYLRKSVRTEYGRLCSTLTAKALTSSLTSGPPRCQDKEGVSQGSWLLNV